MPYTSNHTEPVNFLEMHNGTKLDQGAATLKLQKDRNINMHLYTDLPRGATFKLKYTLKDQTEEKTLVFTKPKVVLYGNIQILTKFLQEFQISLY